MKIGIDIDDTIGNFSETLLNYAFEYDKGLRNNGIINENKNLIDGKFDWTKEEYAYFYKTYIELTGHNMKPFPNVKEVIDYLRKKGNEIIIISARGNDYIDAYDMTIKWLEKYKIKVDKIYLNISEKEKIIKHENIDIFIDDMPNICKIVSMLGVKTYIYSNKHNLEFNDEKIERINNWEEFIEKEGE